MTEKTKTLKEMLAESEMLLEQTGYYYGLEELKLRNEDPLKFEVFHSRMLSSVIAARETCKMISGSPMVREAAELCVGLYTPEGDNVVQSAGIAAHIPVMAKTLKWMISHDYEDEPGINDGDIFCNNDWAVGAIHFPDVYDIVPIFHKGQLIGWAMTVIMEMEIGAVSPGIMPITNWERFSDGLPITAQKTGSNFALHKDFEWQIRMNTRMPDLFLTDRKGAIAADLKVREEVIDSINEFGLDYYLRGIRELIELERRVQLARVKERLVPGRYRNVSTFELTYEKLPVPPFASKDQVILEPVELNVKPDGLLSMDMDGTGPWGWHPCNANPAAMMGTLSLLVTQTLSYTGRANMGTQLALEVKCPDNTIVNPSTTLTACTTSWMNVLNTGGMLVGILGQGFFSRGFLEEAAAGTGGLPSINFSGLSYLTQGGQVAGIPADFAATSGWASPIKDGLNAAGCIHTVELDMGNTEIWELFMPYVQIGKSLNPYATGWGRHRPGLDLYLTYLIHDNSLVMALHTAGTQGHERIIPNTGMFGGYPGALWRWYVAHNTNFAQLVEQRKPLPCKLGDPRNPDIKKLLPEAEVFTLTAIDACPVELVGGDIIVLPVYDCAGGWGDPLERDPSAIEQDLNDGLMVPEMTLSVYGVGCSYDEQKKEWEVSSPGDVKAQRDKMREKRLQKGKPFKEWWAEMRKKVKAGELDSLLMNSYDASMARSDQWSREFKQFWNLPDNFTFMNQG